MILGFFRVVAARLGHPRLHDREWTEWVAVHGMEPLGKQDAAHAGENGSRALEDGFRGAVGGDWWGTPPSSGNRAFDDYRQETLRRLEDEQREFKEFLERLRFAKDRDEFEQFMTDRRNRPSDPNPQPPRRRDLTPRTLHTPLGRPLRKVGGPLRFLDRAEDRAELQPALTVH